MDINKQKFMAELARLLTFMYEEDMKKVLAMYDALFGDACSEKLLLDFLGSPTRQAVMLARAYNAKERKLQINSTSRAEDELEEDSNAEFLHALENLRQTAEEQGVVYGSAQFGFEESDSDAREHKRVWEDRPAEAPLPEQFDLVEPTETVEQEKEAPVEPAETPQEAPVIPVQEEAPAQDNTAEEVKKTPEEKPVETAAVEVKDEDIRFDFSSHAEAPAEEKPVETVKKVSVPLAVLYALFAVPVTLVICTLLLIPTFLALALAAAGIFISFKLISSAFGGFAIFADIMVVLGTGLVMAALGLLFLWSFIWFIGGAIAGVISGALRLGEKLCSREVEVR